MIFFFLILYFKWKLYSVLRKIMSTPLLKVPSLSTCTSAIVTLFDRANKTTGDKVFVVCAIISIHPTLDLRQKAGFCLSATAQVPLAFRGIKAIGLPPPPWATGKERGRKMNKGDCINLGLQQHLAGFMEICLCFTDLNLSQENC